MKKQKNAQRKKPPLQTFGLGKAIKHAQQRVKEICNAVAHPAHKSISAMNKPILESGMLAYLVYMVDRIDQMKMLLKNTGYTYLHCDSSTSRYLKMVMDDVFGHKNFRNEILWERTQSGKSSQHDPKSFGSSSNTKVIRGDGGLDGTGIFIALDGNGWTKGMDEICLNQGVFKTNVDLATEFPVMQYWHVKKLENKQDTCQTCLNLLIH